MREYHKCKGSTRLGLNPLELATEQGNYDSLPFGGGGERKEDMALSRKYYQALAEALAKPTEGYGAGALAQRLVPIVATVQAVADMCYEDNNKFDYRRFYEAFIQEIDNLDDTETESDRSLYYLEMHPEILAPLR